MVLDSLPFCKVGIRPGHSSFYHRPGNLEGLVGVRDRGCHMAYPTGWHVTSSFKKWRCHWGFTGSWIPMMRTRTWITPPKTNMTIWKTNHLKMYLLWFSWWFSSDRHVIFFSGVFSCLGVISITNLWGFTNLWGCVNFYWKWVKRKVDDGSEIPDNQLRDR